MKTPKNFEAGIARLEELLAKIADEATPLAETVKLYAEAAELIEYCTGVLDSTKLQITEIDARLAAQKTAEGEQ